MKLQGYSAPLSPRGTASLVEPTPHHISAEAIQVIFRVGEDVVARYLPPPLEPIEGGLVYAYVADMTKVSAHAPDQMYSNPERTQYKEGIVGFFCRYGDRTGRYSPYIWINQDWSLLFGHIMGWGKKIGRVHLTKWHEFNPGMGPLRPGVKLRGVVDRHGYRLLDMGVELVERLPDGASVPSYGNNVFLLRWFPSTGPQVKPVQQLLALNLKGVRTVDAWKCNGHVVLGDSDNEELTDLQPKEIVGAYYFKRGWTTDGVAELLWDYTEQGWPA